MYFSFSVSFPKLSILQPLQSSLSWYVHGGEATGGEEKGQRRKRCLLFSCSTKACLQAAAYRCVVLARFIGFEWRDDTVAEPYKWRNHCFRTSTIWQNCADMLSEKCWWTEWKTKRGGELGEWQAGRGHLHRGFSQSSTRCLWNEYADNCSSG